MAKKEGSKKKSNQLIIVIVIVILIAALIFFFLKRDISSSDSNDNATNSNSVEISPVELADNKEKYEGKQVKIMNILVPDPLFALVERENGADERLFMEPKKSTYCLHFNLEGKLQKDTSGKRDWIFYVDKFECVSQN